MQDYILNQKELIANLQQNIGEVCLLLTGVDPFAVPSVTEEVTEVNETGLIHDIKLITSCLEYSVCHIKGIKEIIKGNGGSR